MNFKNKAILAPMVSVNEISFRKLCSAHGADIVYSQMIDSIGFFRGNRRLADFFDEDNLVCQFFGNDAEITARCAKEVESKVQAIDLNLGCPHSNVVERKCGSYLMKYPIRIKKIVKALIEAVDVPVTVKIRAGYDKSHINAVKIARLCEAEGVSAIAVHGRPRTVNYEHAVDYGIIKKVKRAVDVPVIGNGDIFCGKDAKRMIDETGCDSIMIGRGAIGNPCIFEEIKAYLAGKELKPVGKKKIFLEYLKYCKKYKTNFKAVRTHTQWFTKGVENGGKYRDMINRTKDIDELKEVYNKIE
ncbi:MAG: tRNA-dihydrouridine synthase family protein [Nanoarchaeota archaeon]|nr:tRNA-dihydrouridine synthase family protein [Nanoarchaeota archaeon]MBU1005524.1 tRNA-dihydrouridine synthase family protein [Nanoarchaeota archaeon]MBU1945863.1 tRNA-dihydrouridine synthase family protein [Nanoarchaeota archaeon]